MKWRPMLVQFGYFNTDHYLWVTSAKKVLCLNLAKVPQTRSENSRMNRSCHVECIGQSAGSFGKLTPSRSQTERTLRTFWHTLSTAVFPNTHVTPTTSMLGAAKAIIMAWASSMPQSVSTITFFFSMVSCKINVLTFTKPSHSKSLKSSTALWFQGKKRRKQNVFFVSWHINMIPLCVKWNGGYVSVHHVQM